VTAQSNKIPLRPFRLAPFFSPRIWGFEDLSPWFDLKRPGDPVGEAWLTGDMCVAETGPLAGRPLSEIVSAYQAELLGGDYVAPTFPLLVKVLFPKEKLSVQVHPDDAMAQKYGDPRGKTECWYTLDAQPDAHVALGVKPGAEAEKIRASILDSRLEDLLTLVPVEKQDMIFVDAGTVHAIGPGVVLLETQQNSDLTYRMYDYGRLRELHIDRSLEAMRMHTRAGKVSPVIESCHTKLIDVPYFRLDRFVLEASGRGALPDSDSDGGRFNDRAQVLFVSEGEATLFADGSPEEPIQLARCQTAIVPAHAGPWSLATSEKAEVIRILPQPGPSPATSAN
jgi:mannose-6-phosphate isomerase